MHKSVFHTNYGDTLLFSPYVLHGKQETFGSCIVVAVMCILFQLLKYIRQKYGRKCQNTDCRRYILNKGHLVQTFMYIVQFVLGYFIMLAVMTFNLWLLIASLLGFGLGYFFFGWDEFEDPNAVRNRSRIRRGNHCGNPAGAASSSATQELLPLSRSTDQFFKGDASDSARCLCDESNKL